MCACESEDLPAALGAPRPAAHRLEDWAYTFGLNPAKVLGELREAQSQGARARPVVLGPITFLALSKAVDGAAAPIGRIGELLPLYRELLATLADAGAD